MVSIRSLRSRAPLSLRPRGKREETANAKQSPPPEPAAAKRSSPPATAGTSARAGPQTLRTARDSARDTERTARDSTRRLVDEIDDDDDELDARDAAWLARRQEQAKREAHQTQMREQQRKKAAEVDATAVNALLRAAANADPEERAKLLAERKKPKPRKVDEEATRLRPLEQQRAYEAARINRLIGMAQQQGVGEIVKVRRTLRNKEGVAVEELPELHQHQADEADLAVAEAARIEQLIHISGAEGIVSQEAHQAHQERLRSWVEQATSKLGGCFITDANYTALTNQIHQLEEANAKLQERVATLEREEAAWLQTKAGLGASIEAANADSEQLRVRLATVEAALHQRAEAQKHKQVAQERFAAKLSGTASTARATFKLPTLPSARSKLPSARNHWKLPSARNHWGKLPSARNQHGSFRANGCAALTQSARNGGAAPTLSARNGGAASGLSGSNVPAGCNVGAACHADASTLTAEHSATPIELPAPSARAPSARRALAAARNFFTPRMAPLSGGTAMLFTVGEDADEGRECTAPETEPAQSMAVVASSREPSQSPPIPTPLPFVAPLHSPPPPVFAARTPPIGPARV